MKLYWGPHTCAIGIHILLEEIGKPYETEKIDVAGGDTHKPAFLAVNPKAKVPTLVRDDHSVLTEFSAIATWLALTNPDQHLLPTHYDTHARAVETLAYIEGTVHGQGYTRIFKPESHEPPDVLHKTLGLGKDAIKKQGKSMVEEGFAILDPALGRHAYAVSDTFTVADAALFYVERWAAPNGITLPVNLAAHLARMKARPAVQKVMAIWGES